MIFQRPFPPLYSVRIVAVLISCLFSIIAILSNPVLNQDAYGYLRAAQLFNETGARAVLDNYGWYGYSILIALFDRVLPGGLLQAAHMFNAATYALLVYVFIDLSLEFRRNTRVAAFAALVILLFPLVNEMRHFLVRDIGFWSFCLLALVQLIRYQRTRSIRHAVLWCLTMLAAVYFRLEGIVLLLLTPCAVLFNTSLGIKARVQSYLLLQGLLLAGAAAVFSVCAAAGINLVDLFQYAYRYYLPGIYNLGELLMGTADELNSVLFAPQNFPGNSGHGLIILTFAYIYTLAVNLVNAMGVPLTVLFLYGLAARRYRAPAHAILPASFMVVGSLVSLLIFMFIMQFITQRYAALSAIILLGFVPLCLEELYLAWKNRGNFNQFKLIGGGFLAFYLLVDSLVSFGYSKSYILEAATWIDGNLQGESTLHTNEAAIAFATGKVEEFDKVEPDASHYLEMPPGSGILALSIDHDDTALLNGLEAREDFHLLARFANDRNDQVRIYRLDP